MTNFVHLHVHSDYSLADASSSVMALADKAEKLGMTHLALTDHGNMFGAMEFIAACKETIILDDKGKEKHKDRKNPVIPIIGCEVYVAPVSRFDRKEAENERNNNHMVLLAATQTGYFNLVRLCSLAYMEGYYRKPRIDNDLLREHHEGLIALSACASGAIPSLISAGKFEEAQKKAVFYRDLFGNDSAGNPNFYLEMMDHGIPADELKGSNYSQKEINNFIIKISKNTGIPLVATNDVHYIEKDDYVSHDILLCIGTKKKRSEEQRQRYYGDQFYFKSGDEMASVFNESPEAIENTVRIAQRCNSNAPNRSKELKKYLPDFEIPSGFKNADDYLRHLTAEGLKKRYAKYMTANGNEWKIINERAEYELKTIINEGFTGYFLIVEDFIKFAKENDVPVGPGRGSGAGSIVAYALQITDVEPLKYNLLFERFLNPERVDMPDFDIDFANDGRESVIEYVTKKYGIDKVGQIITFGTLGAKAVVKDVARVLGISIDESEKITKLISKAPKIKLDKAISEEPRLAEYEKDARYTELFEMARKLEGLKRNSSIHAAGVVIGKFPLIDLVPLYKESESRQKKSDGSSSIYSITQYDKYHLESCGLIKMDFLGLKTLDVIKNTEILIRKKGGKYSGFSIDTVPEDDKKTFKMLGEGNCYAIFQFEEDFIQDFMKQSKPSSIEDLTALNAMNRPGPMKFLPQFVESKLGKMKITYPDPSLEGILKETYGVIVYQEQVMQVAQIFASFTLGLADEMRKAMGKKIQEKMDKIKVKFIKGAKEKGYTEEKANEIWEILDRFAGYGFNKSHAAAYSIVAYRTAYLKANFPAEFMAANLTNNIESSDKDKLSKCIEETRKMGLIVDPPDINHSNIVFSVVEGRIVYGFKGIKGVGNIPAQEIIRCREEGPYKNFMDFLDRVDIKAVSKKVILLLIQTGAFDNLGVTRENLEGNCERAIEYALKSKEDKQFGQSSLFDDTKEEILPDFKFDEIPKKSRTDKLNQEKELIGFYFSGHPLDEYKDIWNECVNVNLAEKEKLKTGSCILIGVIKKLKSIITKQGKKMAFATLEDYNGEIELTFFTNAWEKLSGRLENDKVYIFKGKIEYLKDKDKYGFLVDDIVNRFDIKNMIKEIKETEEKDKMHRITWLYMADLKSSYIKQVKRGSYTIIGYLKRLKETKDSNKNDMAFGTLQDFEGEIELIFFNRVYSGCRHLLNLNEIIALKGTIDPDKERDPEKITFYVSSIASLPQLSRMAAKKDAASETPLIPEFNNADEKQKTDVIHIKLTAEEKYNKNDLLELRDFMAENSGSFVTYIHIPVKDGETIMRSFSGLDITNNELLDSIKKCKCVTDVWRV
ncbi:MAG: DNA polymerase III subunit alpha [Treponema sp.]|nr:DNA polymerase III subunit alpha [Treponema sp.]MCL2252389.1 DNA polymerase III subunit alpha [Treponema sp.]